VCVRERENLLCFEVDMVQIIRIPNTLVAKWLKLIRERTIKILIIKDCTYSLLILLSADGLTMALRAEEWGVKLITEEFLEESL
jgi:hypothetical protein